MTLEAEPLVARGPDAAALEPVLRGIVPGGRLVSVEPIGSDSLPGAVRKEGGYARAWRVTALDRAGEQHRLVFRVAGGDEFGHDRRSDRAQNLLLAFDTFREIPDHVRTLDVGVVTPTGLRSLRDAREPYLVTTYAEGRLYAEDLQRIAADGAASALDVARCEALARWLAALHARHLEDPVAWRRALRDLVGHGEGIFGIADAYGAQVPAAPPERLARIEHRCVDWRWRLRDRAERLRRTHGDFHPFNLVFSEGTRFTALDASRGCAGDAADDVIALSVNYVFFALQAPGAWPRGFAPLWRAFWEAYLARAGRGALEAAPPFLAWRALVLGCPRFYPALPADVRDRLLGLAERALEAPAFDPAGVEELFP